MTLSFRHFPLAAVTIAATLGIASAANGITGAANGIATAATATSHAPKLIAELPDVVGFFDDQNVDYIVTEASDPGFATALNATYVPALANVLDAPNQAFDDIYIFTNVKQNNIIASVPTPEGPGNTDPNYSPLWRANLVKWADPSKAYTLRSEAEVRAAEAAQLVTVTTTHIVIDCPVIHSPEGGTFPGAEIEIEHGR